MGGTCCSIIDTSAVILKVVGGDSERVYNEECQDFDIKQFCEYMDGYV